jgi:hypothetical protein
MPSILRHSSMPTSAAEGRDWFTHRLADTTVGTIVDVGPGEGTHSVLGRHLRLEARWVGVEVHEPYVDRFLLGQKYDDVIVGDARSWLPELDDYGIRFGDVLEHMPVEDAWKLLSFHLERATFVYVSVPIIYAPQGAWCGNDHETHHHHYHYEEMLGLLPGCEGWKGNTVGRFWWQRSWD